MKKIIQIGTAIMMTFVMTGCQKEEMALKGEEFNVEYGENIPTDVKNYLDNSDEFMKNTEISGIPENEKGKTYPAIGQYELKLVNEKMQEKVTVNVQDTTAPVFTDKNTSVTIENGKKIDTKIFKVQDLSEVKITIDDSQIDYTKAGDYIIKVKATDKSNNSTEKEVKLTIKKKETKTNTENSSTTKNTPSSKTSKTSGSSNTSNKTSTKGNQSSNSTSQNNGSSSSSGNNSDNSSNNSGNSSSSSQKHWISNLNVAKNYSKIMIASAPSSSSRQGTFTYYQKVNGDWKEVLETTADFGKAGLGTASESSTKTPIGQYTFTKLMGISPNPGTNLAYHKIDSNDYWCGETLYNQFVDEDVTEHHCSKNNDEHLIDYSSQYKYAAAFSYNTSNIKGKESAFFLHCANSIHYTGGCVAIPTSQMKKVMQAIDGNTVFIIDLESNITNY